MFRITIRELLLLPAFVAVGCATLKYASEVWYVLVASAAMISLILAGIVVAVDRGRSQAVAIGFALSVMAYGGLFVVADYELPSTKAFHALYWSAVVSEGYVDPGTGQEVLGEPAKGLKVHALAKARLQSLHGARAPAMRPDTGLCRLPVCHLGL